MSTQAQKCPACDLVNFATADSCKRCGYDLTSPPETTPQPSIAIPLHTLQADTGTSLTPCPDCSHLCSNLAASCPNCGRKLQLGQLLSSSVVLISLTAVGALVAIVLAVYFFGGLKRDAEVRSAVQAENPIKAGPSLKNKEAAKAAINAIGEVQSVTSVGTTYAQYTTALQSAKIKYDAAMRDFKPQDPSEHFIQSQLESTLKCYLDASEAWEAFIRDGDKYGFLDSANRVVSPMESRYGFHSQDRQYYKSSVISAIWAKASEAYASAKMD